MNNSTTQAQKGFKTFILTLVVSLLVFSAIYTVINYGSSVETLGVSDSEKIDSSLQSSVFEDISNKKMNVEPRAVLAGADVAESEVETEETTTPVPDTGVSTSIFGVLVSVCLIALAIFYKNETFLAKFEKRALKDLN